jgi:hypothetical protein
MTILFSPETYKKLTATALAAIANGCGAVGWKIDLVPDTLYGLGIRAACDIHDYMYHTGETIEDKNEADRVFLNNMLRLITAKTKHKWLRRLRRRRALLYYFAVKNFGGPAFWDGKQSTVGHTGEKI